MKFKEGKFIGFLGFLSLLGLKGFITGNYLWFMFFINLAWFTFFYENSIVYKSVK
jgi:hypothetical protein